MTRLGVIGLAALVACGGSETAGSASAGSAASAKVSVAEAPVAKERPPGKLRGILMSQAQFVKGAAGKTSPGPAKLVLWRTDGDGGWWDEIIEDPGSNVFHKAIGYRDGLLTIAAGQIPKEGETPAPAQMRHWKHDGTSWAATTLVEAKWGGRFQRFRDFEFGDFNADGTPEIAISTHDMGVVMVASEGADGAWSAQQMDEKPDTFVHEIEVGDVDGDGAKEFYCTPSDRNRSSGESQPGSVARYDLKDGKYVRSWVAQWEHSHAKEILVADVDGDKRDELYVVREGHVVKEGGTTKLTDPVQILRMDPGPEGWTETIVASLEGESQTRFLVPGDVDHDGKTDLVAAAMKTGLWVLKRSDDGKFTSTVIDPNSGGFEHATHVADLDGDGKVEIYVAADKQREVRRYLWNGATFDKVRIGAIPEKHITWNLQDGTF